MGPGIEDQQQQQQQQQLTTLENINNNDNDEDEKDYRARYPNEAKVRCACPSIKSDKTKTNKKQRQQYFNRNTFVPYDHRRRQQRQQQRQLTSVQHRVDANDPHYGRRRPIRQFMATHCAGVAKNDERPRSKINCKRRRRMRGGGGVGAGGCGEHQQQDAALFSGDADYTWYNRRFVTSARLEGGGGGTTVAHHQAYPAVGCGKSGATKNIGFDKTFDTSYVRTDNINPQYLSLNRCKLQHVESTSREPKECTCPSKDNLEELLKKKGQAMCRKKPCLGTDCLIKAFHDAQDFVDSIGKLPGLAGLGIVDTPYFPNRPQEPKEVKKNESKSGVVNKQQDLTNNLCSLQNIENLKRSNYNAMTSSAGGTAKKYGVVQEGPNSFPDPLAHQSLRPKKKIEEKSDKPKESENSAPKVAEDTPCGEPKCKSRPKKVGVEKTEVVEKEETTAQKTVSPHRLDKKYHTKGRSQSVPSDRTKKPIKFDYAYGSAYPVSVYGHKKCNLLRPRVPARMGWMWNETDPVTKIKPRTGWRPGAISVALRELLREAKEGFFKEAKRPMSLPRLGGKRGGKTTAKGFTGMKKNNCEEGETEEEIEHPPTLHVHRKDGTYYVTMYPIRQDATDEPGLEEPTNPLQFKIVKSKDSLASSSTASDMEIEFSPPAAVNRPRRRRDVVHVETQVKQQEILDSYKKVNPPSKQKDAGKKKKDVKKKK